MSCDPQRLIEAHGRLRAQPGQIHVWAFDLSASPHCLDFCGGQLSPGEQARAQRFVRPSDREEFTVAHGVVRCLLGRYCGVAPTAVEFGSGAAKKPFVRKPETKVSFNLSHSGGRALLAIGAGQEIGIDLEQLRPEVEALTIGQRYFFGPEFEDIASAPPKARHERFFRYWVAKEAVLKAQGVGLGFPLDRFYVRFDSAGDRGHVVTFDPEQLRDDWTVRMLPCKPGWFAALAAQGDDWNVILKS
jgi:4'-phosphopantetheinyl transferase